MCTGGGGGSYIDGPKSIEDAKEAALGSIPHPVLV